MYFPFISQHSLFSEMYIATPGGFKDKAVQCLLQLNSMEQGKEKEWKQARGAKWMYCIRQCVRSSLCLCLWMLFFPLTILTDSFDNQSIEYSARRCLQESPDRVQCHMHPSQGQRYHDTIIESCPRNFTVWGLFQVPAYACNALRHAVRFAHLTSRQI